jgi:metallo-beta-lactamase family protein
MIGRGHSPFEFDSLHCLWSRKHSLKIAGREGAGIVLAGSGFCDAGPVLHHLENALCHDRGFVVFTGYVLPGSMAESLASGVAKRVRINGTEIDVRARISRVPGLVVLNHGDDAARVGMETRIMAAMPTKVARPACQDIVLLA